MLYNSGSESGGCRPPVGGGGAAAHQRGSFCGTGLEHQWDRQAILTIKRKIKFFALSKVCIFQLFFRGLEDNNLQLNWCISQ